MQLTFLRIGSFYSKSSREAVRSVAMSKSKHHSGLAIMQALLAVGLAVAVHAAMPGMFLKRVPFAPFAAAVLVSCRWGGRSAGFAATVASAMVLDAWFLPAAHTIWDEARLGLGIFVAAGMVFSAQMAAPKTK